MRANITIAIVTKNRIKELARCLDSLLIQSQKSQKIIVIDNDHDHTAKQVIVKNKYQQLPIVYYTVDGSVPKCRNFAIVKCKSKYLAFTDDDCLLDQNWIKNGINKIRNGDYDFVVGQTKLYNPENLFALAQHTRDEYWKKQNSPMFDTKNVILNLATIKKHQLMFDEKCQKSVYDSADFDFDFVVKKYKLKGSFCKKMIVYHKETKQFIRFIRRAYYRGYLGKYLDRKWQLEDQLVDLSTRNFIIWLLKLIKNYFYDYKRYAQKMSQAPVCNKILANLIIKIFEFCYVSGYVANKKTF